MNLPILDISILPDLDVLTGVFGSLQQHIDGGSDDSAIILMVFLYEVLIP